jgi:hypothetical protein
VERSLSALWPPCRSTLRTAATLLFAWDAAIGPARRVWVSGLPASLVTTPMIDDAGPQTRRPCMPCPSASTAATNFVHPSPHACPHSSSHTPRLPHGATASPLCHCRHLCSGGLLRTVQRFSSPPASRLRTHTQAPLSLSRGARSALSARLGHPRSCSPSVLLRAASGSTAAGAVAAHVLGHARAAAAWLRPCPLPVRTSSAEWDAQASPAWAWRGEGALCDGATVSMQCVSQAAGPLLSAPPLLVCACARWAAGARLQHESIYRHRETEGMHAAREHGQRACMLQRHEQEHRARDWVASGCASVRMQRCPALQQ